MLCNFHTFQKPEMTKIRPVIVLSPRFNERADLCTVVACSTTTPLTIMPYHDEIEINPTFPPPYDSPKFWIKGDMVYAISISRLKFFSCGKSSDGTRIYDKRIISAEDLQKAEKCVLTGLGIKP